MMDKTVIALHKAYNLLKPATQKLWCRLAVFVGPFSLPMAREIWQVAPRQALETLNRLLACGLVEKDATPMHYRLSDTARLLADANLSQAERSIAQLRHALFYLGMAWRARNLCERDDDSFERGIAVLARIWPDLQAAQAWAASRNDDETANKICNEYPMACFHFLHARCAPGERLPWFEAGLSASRRLNDRTAESGHLACMGIAWEEAEQFQRADECYKQWRAIAHELDHRLDECDALCHLGALYARTDQLWLATRAYKSALRLAREAGDQKLAGDILLKLGYTCLDMGSMRFAMKFFQQRLALAQQMEDRRGELEALGSMGYACNDIGNQERAREFYERALLIAREIGYRRGEAQALLGLSVALSNRAEAITYAQAAIEIFDQQQADRARAILNIIQNGR